MNVRIPFSTFCFALVICKNTDGKYLAVKETRNRGWWIPGGLVDPTEDFFKAAKRETKEETGIDIEITGILRVEHSVQAKASARMRVLFFAVPSSDKLVPKSKPDDHSEAASWLSISEILSLRSRGLLRGEELYDWPNYIENGGMITPTSFFTDEDEDPNNLTLEEICKYSRKQSSGMKTVEEVKFLNLEEEFIYYLKENNIANIRKIIFEGSIDINSPINEKMWSPLIFSIKNRYEEIVSILLIMKANLFQSTHKKRNCVHLAIQSSLNIFNALLISINSLDNESKLILLNQKDVFGDTPLHIAALNLINENDDESKRHIYNSLLLAGSRPDIKNSKDLTPMRIIEKYKK